MAPVPQVSRQDFQNFLSTQPVGPDGKPQVRRSDLEAFLSGTQPQANALTSQFPTGQTANPMLAARLGVPFNENAPTPPISPAEVTTGELAATMLAPGLTGVARIPAGLGFLGRLGQYAKIAGVGSVAGEVAKQGFETVGAAPPTSLSDKVGSAALNTAFGTALPGAIDAGQSVKRVLDDGLGNLAKKIPAWATNLKIAYENKFGIRPSDLDILNNPNNKPALDWIQRNNPNMLRNDPSKPFRVEEGTRTALQDVQNLANRGLEGVGAQMGAAGGDAAVEQTLAKNFYQKGQTAIDAGVFDDAKNVKDALGRIETLKTQWGVKRGELLQQLDQTGVKVGSSDIQPFIQDLDKTIESYAKNADLKPFADALREQRNKILYDTTVSGGMTPSQAVEYQQNLNYFRRQILREFDKNPIIETGGDQIKSAARKASVEAISSLQSGISQAVDSKLPEALKGQLGELNKVYGGLDATEELLHKSAYGTLKGLSNRDLVRVVQNAGQENLVTAFANKANPSVRGMVGAAWNTAKERLGAQGDEITDAGMRFHQQVNRDEHIIQNIQDLMRLQQSPVALPPDSPPIPYQPVPGRSFSSPSATQLAGNAQMAMLPAMIGAANNPQQAQAMEMAPPTAAPTPQALQQAFMPPAPAPQKFPRELSVALQNPTAFAGAVFELAKAKMPAQLAQSLAMQVEHDLSSGNTTKQEATFDTALQMFPEAFEPAPFGYKSFRDGRLYDPIEKQDYANRVVTSPASDTEKARNLAQLRRDSLVMPMGASTPAKDPNRTGNPMTLSDVHGLVSRMRDSAPVDSGDQLLSRMRDISQIDVANSGL